MARDVPDPDELEDELALVPKLPEAEPAPPVPLELPPELELRLVRPSPVVRVVEPPPVREPELEL